MKRAHALGGRFEWLPFLDLCLSWVWRRNLYVFPLTPLVPVACGEVVTSLIFQSARAPTNASTKLAAAAPGPSDDHPAMLARLRPDLVVGGDAASSFGNIFYTWGPSVANMDGTNQWKSIVTVTIPAASLASRYSMYYSVTGVSFSLKTFFF